MSDLCRTVNSALDGALLACVLVGIAFAFLAGGCAQAIVERDLTAIDPRDTAAPSRPCGPDSVPVYEVVVGEPEFRGCVRVWGY